MKNLVSTTNLDYLLRAVKQFGDIDIRLDSYSTLPLELALISSILTAEESNKKADAGLNRTIKTELKKPVSSIKTVKPPKEKIERQAPIQDEDTPPEPVAEKHETHSPSHNKTAASDKSREDANLVSIESDPDASDGIAAVRGKWNDFIKALRGVGSKGNLDAMLRSACEPVDLEGNVLTLGFYATFHKEYIEDQKYKFLVEKKLLEFFGKPYKINCVMTEKSSKESKKSSITDSPAVKAAIQRGAKLIE